MNKITDIEITKYRTSYQKDALGNRNRIRTPYKANRTVKVVEGGKRFAHYFIDGIIFSFLSYPIDKFIAWLGIGAETYGYAILISLFPIYIGYSLYYFLFEYYFQSTPGKMLTNTLVINQFRQKPNLNELIVRSLVRLVPFEPFSCLSDRGWHDRWSGTWVISKAENEKLRQYLEKN